MARRTSIHLVKIWLRRKVYDNWPIKKICEVYGISRSTFYRWLSKYKKGEISLEDYEVDLEGLGKDLSIEESSEPISSFTRVPELKSSPDVGMRAVTEPIKAPEYHPVKVLERELPNSYNRLYAYLLPRDPYWAFCYWEIPPSRFEGYNSLVLRVLDVTEEKEYVHFDVNVGKMLVGNWYIPIGVPDRYYLVSILGRRDEGVDELVRTNVVYLPRDYALSPPKSKLTKPYKYDFDVKIDWAISSLADFMSSFYFSL